MLRALAVSFLLALGAACPASAVDAPPVRVLFIGNSLVASPQLPQRLTRLAGRLKRDVHAEAVTHDDYSLSDHWQDGRAQARIREGWDFVILQQGPSARPASRDALLADAKRFAEVIRGSGGKPVLFSAWPARSNPEDFPAAIASWRAAAAA